MSLKEHIIRQNHTRRISNTARRPMHEDVGGIQVTRSPDLASASIALPAGIDLDDRAARMNEFWRALAEFQHRNVLVVALCAGDER